MSSTLNTAGQWYYERDNTVLFINEDEKKVGILTQTPEYELDVNGTINAITYCNLPPFALSNQIYQLANNTSNVAYNALTISTYSSNTSYYTSNNMVVNGNIVTLSNLNILDTLKRNGSNIVDTDGKIDYQKWLKNTPIQEDDDGNIIIPIPVITYINTVINNNTGGGGGSGEDHDPGYNEDSIYVHWNNVIHNPIYKNINDLRIGFGSNIYVENKSKIYGIDKSELLSYDGGKFKRISTNLVSDDLWYDFQTKRMYLNKIDCAERIFSSNLTASNALIQTISSESVVSPIITCSNFETVNVISTSLINASNVNMLNLTSCNINTSNFTSCNISSKFATTSNLNSSNIFASNIDTRTFIAINTNSSNINASNILTSNIINVNLWTSNITSSNLSTNLFQATSINTQTFITDTLTSRLITTSNITACNVKDLSDNFLSFSNQSWKFNGSNIWHGSNEFVIAIGKSNATEKLDVVGNIKASGGGSFANNNFVISSNTSAVHSLIINNSNILRTDGNIGNHFLTHLNNLTGNQTFTGIAGDIYDPKTQSSNLYTNWNSVLWKPIYQDNLFNLGFSSNVFFNRFSQLCTTEPAWDYSKTSNGMFKSFSSPFVRSNVVIDFNTYTATLCNVITSNATINFNLTTSNIRTSNLLTSNITTSNVYGINANLSNLWASNVGINQLNPLYNLDVNGGARIQTNLLVNRDIICTSNATFGSNVGIGTINPAYKLDVLGDARINSSFIGDVGFGSTTAGFAHTSRIDTASYALTQLNDGTTNLNSAPGRPIHFRTNGVIFMTMSNGWLGIRTPNPAYSLDVNGASAFRNGNGNVGWTNNQILLGFNGTNTYQHAINTRHNVGGGNTNSIDFLLWNNNVSSTSVGNCNAMSITATGIGIFNSNPTYILDVNGNTRLNNAFIGDVGWGSSLAGFAHQNCISQTNYALLQQSTGQTYLNCATSRTINFRVNNQDTMIMNNNTLGIQGANVIEFGQGVAGKEGNAGKVGYGTFTTNTLDIIGAGTTTRNIKLWDNVTIADKLTITGLTEFGTGGIKVSSGGTTIKNMIGGSVEIGTDNDNYGFTDVTLTLGGASANYSVFPSVQQAGSSADSFTIKWHNVSSSGSTNTFRISIYRTDQMGWGNTVRVHYFVVVY